MSPISIAQTVQGIPVGHLEPHIDAAGPYGPGNHVLSTWDDSGTVKNVDNTFGVVVQISGAIPQFEGRTFGVDDGGTVVLDVFESPILQLACLHQLYGGVWIATQVEFVNFAPALFRWYEALPGKIGLYVSPNWSVDLYYLLFKL